jgi:hypothetical protein
MSFYRIVFTQAAAGGGANAAAHATHAPEAVRATPLGKQIGEQVRKSIQDATRGVVQSNEVQRELRAELRNAEGRVRDAEHKVRLARTDDQRGAAEQELFGARAEVDALRGVVQAGPGIGHTGQVPSLPQDMIPPQVVDISIAFFIMMAVIVIGWPLARAFGKRLERRGEISAGPDPVLSGQLQRIEQAVEAMSIEIERISESQRFLAKLQGGAAPDRSALGAGERR